MDLESFGLTATIGTIERTFRPAYDTIPASGAEALTLSNCRATAAMRPESGPNSSDESTTAAVERLESAVERSIRYWIRRDGEVIDDDRRAWIVAVSGGPDSVALLYAIFRRFAADRRLIVAHVNHHSRMESDTDEAFVRELAESLGLPCEIGHWQPSRKSHFEADARRARHELLAEIATKHDAAAILTAHTRDDQAETVLMRLARGTGPAGAAGIRPWRRLKSGRTELVRPLLGVSKREVLAYLEAREVDYRNDPTNDDVDSQTRAWVRHVLVPLAENRLNPKFAEAVAKFAELQAEEQQGLDAWVRRRWRKTFGVPLPGIATSMDLKDFRRFGPAWLRRRGLRLMWDDWGQPQREMTHERWIGLERWLVVSSEGNGESRRTMPGGVIVTISRGAARFRCGANDTQATRKSDLAPAEPVPFEWPGMVRLNGTTLRAEPAEQVPSTDDIRRLSGQIGVMDAARVYPPLVARLPEPGDRFDPIGLNGSRQKIVDYLRSRGVIGDDKRSVWLVADRQGIVWVVGHSVSDRVKIRPETESVWIVRAEATDEGNLDP